MRTQKKTVGLLCLVLAQVAAVYGADVSGTWLQIPESTREAALGGAFGALADDMDALDVNPAGLAELSGDEAGFLHNSWAQGLSTEHFSYGHGFNSSGLALSGDYLDFGQVSLYSVNGLNPPVANGSFSPMGLDLYCGYGFQASPEWRFGLDAKFISESLASGTGSSTGAVDLGVQYKNFPTGLILGASFLNLGGSLEGADLPLALDLAAAFQPLMDPSEQFSLAADLDWSLNDPNGTTGSLGAEYWIKNAVALRAGYRFAAYGSLQDLVGLSAGAGIRLGQAELDYAWTALGDLGSANQLSLSYRFGASAVALLPAPGGLNASQGADQTLVTWNAVPGAVGYNFYVQKPEDNGLKLSTSKPITDTNVSLDHLDPEKTYRIAVSTVNSDGKEGPLSEMNLEPSAAQEEIDQTQSK